MAASIEEVSGNAERSSDVARHSVEVAHKGGEAVRRTIDGMNAIREPWDIEHARQHAATRRIESGFKQLVRARHEL